MRIKMKRFLGILLTLTLVLGLMPGMSLTAYAATAYTSGQIKIANLANGDIIRGTCTIYQNSNRALEIYDTDGTTLLQQYNYGSAQTLSALGYDTIVTKTGVGSGDYDNRLVKLQKLSPSPTVTSVTLDKNELSLDAGGATAELIATVEANYDAIKGVTWSSSDSTVATVNSNGVITPVGAGDPVTIKATSTWDNTKYAECVVTVNAAHTHSFTYSPGGATITATCSEEGCTLPESSAGAGDHVATLTISANGGTYDGTTAYGATIIDANSIQGDAKVQYQKKTGESYGTATETAPKDAGDYKASITVGGATARVEYTIAKANPTANAPTGLTATYGQTLANVTLTNPEGNTPGTWAWADAATTSVGSVGAHTFKANFTPTDTTNYNSKSNVDVTVTVGKADNPATVTSTATVTKGGNTVDLAGNVTKNGATGDVSYAISGEANGCSLSDSVLTSGDKTGTVTVNVTVATDENYNALCATPITVTISDKGTQTITASDVTATYGDTGKSVSASVTDPATGGGAVSYAVKEGSADYIDVNATTGALTIKKVPSDGKAYVVVTAAETATYEQATKEVTVTINKANAVSATVTANNRTYDGTEKPLVTEDNSTLAGGVMWYALGENATTAPADNLYTTSIPTGTDAGTYYVWYKAFGDSSHNDSVAACVTVTIAPKSTEEPATEEPTTEEPTTETPKTPKGTLTKTGIFCAQDHPSIIAAFLTEKSEADDTIEYRWIACEESNPSAWFVVSDWTKDNYYLSWTPDKSGDYIIVAQARLVGNEENTLVADSFGVNFRKVKAKIKDICQMPYEDGYLIGIESNVNPNQSLKYEMLVMDLSLYAAGNPNCWVHSVKGGVAEGCALWTIWKPQYGYYITLFRIYDADDNILDETAYGFVNAY